MAQKAGQFAGTATTTSMTGSDEGQVKLIIAAPDTPKIQPWKVKRKAE